MPGTTCDSLQSIRFHCLASVYDHGVEWVEVELFTSQHNDAVLRLPARRFPGALLQRDGLQTLTEDAERAQQALRGGDVAAAADGLDVLVALGIIVIGGLFAAGIELYNSRSLEAVGHTA